MKLTTIYYLHKGNNIPCYVGETSSIQQRLNSHKKTYGSNIQMEVLMETFDWRKWEQYYINKFINQGYILDNKNKGGGGVAKGTPKPKGFGKNISQQRKGNWVIPQHQIDAGIKARNKVTEQYDKEGILINVYDSSKLAAEAVGVHEVNMRLHLGGKYKTCKGYIFKYKEL